MDIITLKVVAKGEIISNNLPEFRQSIQLALGNINRDLKTDEEFGQAVVDVAKLKELEDAVRLAALQAFDEKIKAMQAELTATAEDIRAPRLELEKLIDKRKEQVKQEIIDEAMQDLVCVTRLKQAVFGRSVSESLKGKKLLDSMKKAVNQMVAIHNSMILRNRDVITTFCVEHGEGLVLDADDLEVKSMDSVTAELRRRLEASKAIAEKKALEAKKAAVEAELKLAKAETIEVKSVKPVVTAEAPAEITPSDEWAAFQSEVFRIFAMLKTEGNKMIHLENIEKMNTFGAGINQAWKEANK